MSSFGIYGSNKAAQFVQDVISGKASVDFVHIGDSNTGFSSTGETFAGYVDGFSVGMEALSPGKMFASPLYSLGAQEGPNYGYTLNHWPGAVSGAGNNASSRAASFAPTGSGPNVSAVVGRMQSPLWVNGQVAGMSASWISEPMSEEYAGQKWANFSLGIYIDASSKLETARALTYRIVHAKVTNPLADPVSGMTVHLSAAVGTANGSISFAGPNGEVGHSSYTFPAVPGRANQATSIFTAGGGVGISNGMNYPFALCWNSVHCNRKGWASNVLSHHGGGNLITIAANVTGTNSGFYETYFREIIERQSQAGSFPARHARTIVVINNGQNGGDGTPVNDDNNWLVSGGPICAKLQAGWADAGGLPENIAFLFLTSHQFVVNDTDRLVTRQRAILAAKTWVGVNVTAANLPEMVSQATMVSGLFFDHPSLANVGTDVFNAHLSEAGYTHLSSSVLKSLIGSNTMATNVTTNPTTTVPAFAPGFRGESQQYVTPTIANSAVIALPKVETFPAIFAVTCPGFAAASSRHGIVTAQAAGIVTVHNGLNMVAGAPADIDDIGVTITAGVITFTVFSSTTASSLNPITVVRLG